MMCRSSCSHENSNGSAENSFYSDKRSKQFEGLSDPPHATLLMALQVTKLFLKLCGVTPAEKIVIIFSLSSSSIYPKSKPTVP